MVAGQPAYMVSSAWYPWFSGIVGAMCISYSANIDRRCGDRVRIVSSISAVSGMMWFVLPAAIFAMVITAGSKTEMRRVTIVWIAVTIAQATGIGSIASCGIEAWPPAPLTLIEIGRAPV